MWHIYKENIKDLLGSILKFLAAGFALIFCAYFLWHWSFYTKQTGNFYIGNDKNRRVCVLQEIEWGLDEKVRYVEQTPDQDEMKKMSDDCIELHRKWKDSGDVR